MTYSLPKAFCERVASDAFLGVKLLDALEMPAPVSVRFNPQKSVAKLDIKKSVPWCKDAYYLRNRPIFTLDPLFHAGTYYPQEAGSMVLDDVFRSLSLPDEPVILDLCAAPGGKSTLIASFLNGKGLLVSNEIVPQRAYILRENMVKWGAANTMVTSNKPSDFKRLPHFFDVVVVDAPCSGEGMFRKDKDARNEWSEGNVQLCADRQRKILADVWEALQPGGYLIYATCTFNRFENEDNIRWMIEAFGAEVVPFKLPETLIADRKGIGAYCLPGITESEGFYFAILQKPAEEIRGTRFMKGGQPYTDIESLMPGLMKEGFTFYQREEWLYAVPQNCEKEMRCVQSLMHTLKMGVAVGSIARKGIIPSIELGLAPGLLSLETPRVEVKIEEALCYLRGDTFSVDGADGWNLLSYEKENIGWIKKIGNRFNNHYPKEWRIRMRMDG